MQYLNEAILKAIESYNHDYLEDFIYELKQFTNVEMKIKHFEIED